MLLYHPAIDFFHCWMRFASILYDFGVEGVEYDRIRIVDYLLCFPSEVRNCRLPVKQSGEIRKQIGKLPRSYEDPNSLKQAFVEMYRIQKQVTMDMVAKNIIQREMYREGLLVPNVESFAMGLLQAAAQNWKVRDEEWYHLTLKTLYAIPLNGKDGLKARSGLLEYRYDR